MKKLLIAIICALALAGCADTDSPEYINDNADFIGVQRPDGQTMACLVMIKDGVYWGSCDWGLLYNGPMDVEYDNPPEGGG